MHAQAILFPGSLTMHNICNLRIELPCDELEGLHMNSLLLLDSETMYVSRSPQRKILTHDTVAACTSNAI